MDIHFFNNQKGEHHEDKKRQKTYLATTTYLSPRSFLKTLLILTYGALAVVAGRYSLRERLHRLESQVGAYYQITHAFDGWHQACLSGWRKAAENDR